MSRSIILSIALVIMLALSVSCSSNGPNVVTPPDVRDSVSESAGGTFMMGLWQFTADPATNDISWTQLRSADAVINVIGFMEPPPLTLMDLDWPNLVIDGVAGTIDVGVILTHPIAGDDVFMGFDVRGVCFGPRVANADGATIIPGPEYFTGIPFGYQDGLVGTPDSVGNFTGLAGYKYFCDGLGADDDLATFMSDELNLEARGSFGSGNTNQRNYNLVWDDLADFFVFNYAIYANYDWPVGDPPIGIDNFAITTANSAEAFAAKITENSNSLYWVDAGTFGGSIDLDVEVWDWLGNISDCTIEAPGVIALTGPGAGGPGTTSKSQIFNFGPVAGAPVTSADLDIIVTATDAATFGESWFMDLLPVDHELYSTQIYNAFIHRAAVSDCPPCTLTSINPASGKIGNDLVGVQIIGADILDGVDLGVTLSKAGETDIVATNAAWVSATEISCDISIPDDALLEGSWDVTLYNGCGTPANVLEGGFEVTVLFSESFDSDPADWYYGTYQYWSTCTQGAPAWRNDTPYAIAAGAAAVPATGSTLAGGAVATIVSPPFEVPTGSTDVILRSHVMWDLGGSYASYCKTNFKMVVSNTPGLSGFSQTGNAGTILARNTAHGSANPGTWTNFNWSYMGGYGWQGNFNNWPSNFSNYVDVTIPAAFYGQTVKFALQVCPDWCGYPGSNTGIVLDNVELMVF